MRLALHGPPLLMDPLDPCVPADSPAPPETSSARPSVVGSERIGGGGGAHLLEDAPRSTPQGADPVRTSQVEVGIPSASEFDVEHGVSESSTSVSTNAELCVICYSVVKNKRTLECGHVFCGECIDEWAKRNPSCPSCRKRLDSTEGPEVATAVSTPPAPDRPWSRHWTMLVCCGTLCFLVIGILVWVTGRLVKAWN